MSEKVMNEILKKRIEEARIEGSRHYNPNVSKYSQGKQVGYLRGFNEGAEYALSHQWISVDEALPEENSNVSMNVYVKVDTGHGIEHCVFLATYVLGKFSCETTRVKVIAWLPIPKFELNKPE